MTVTSANINHLRDFVNGSQRRLDRLSGSLERAINKANVVMPACSGSQYPSTPSLTALNELLGSWVQNQEFVRCVHDDLVEADQYDADGNATVQDTVIDASLRTAGLDQAPDLVEVAAIELYGQPPYSGFVDDPICLANGNFLLRDADLRLFGVSAAMSVVRTYNSRDQRTGAFGPGWSSPLDVDLLVAGGQASFRGPDGGGSAFHQLEDGTWAGGRRRRQSLAALDAGWQVTEGHERSWTFDADGTLVAFTALAADVVVERRPDEVVHTDRTSGRSVTYRLDPATGLAASAVTSDGREVTYAFDGSGRLVAVARACGDATYTHDDHGFLATVVDADGIVVCRNEYDPAGRVLSQVEHHGRETRYEYRPDGVSTVTASDGAPPNVMVHDRRGRMTAMIDGLGNTMRIAYDDADNVVQVVDRTGATTRYTHDERGNVLVRTDTDGLTHRCTWDEADRLVEVVDRAGGATRFEYAGDQRDPVRIVQPDGAESRLTYDAQGLPTSVVDADGVSAQLAWSRDGLLEAVTDGLGAQITFTYDAAGRSVGVTAPEGIEAAAELDAAGRMLALRTAEGARRFDYTAAGRVVGGLDQAGEPWHATLDDAGELAALSDGQGPILRFERDLVGQVVATVDASGARATYEHDPVGRRTAIVDPEGNRTEIDFDPEGRPVQVTDPSGRRASRELDVLGRTIMAVRPGGGTSVRSYHPNGQLASATDAAGQEWTYEVDAMGRVTSSTDPLGGVTTYRYTPAGRLAEVRTPLGRTLRREYDAAGRLARLIEPDGTVVHVERRADGAVRRVVRDGVETTFDYDESGQASAIAGPWGELSTRRQGGLATEVARRGAAAQLDYDARGLLQRVVDPAGVVTEFTHDRCGRLVAHTTAGASEATYGWDGAGRLASITDVYGQQTTFDRDPRGIVERISRPDGSATVRTFGPEGHLDGAVDGAGNQLLSIEHDAAGRVVSALTADARADVAHDALGRICAFGTDAGRVEYTWDADGYLVALGDDTGYELVIERDAAGTSQGFVVDGRRIDLPAPIEPERDEQRRIVTDEHGRRYDYDLAGRLAQVTVGGAATTYGYDDLGLLATERHDGGVRTYRYGRAGELVAQVHEDGTETAYEYDATGRRTRQVQPDGSQVDYSWDAFGRLSSVERRDPAGTATVHRIEHDPMGRPMRIDGVPILWDSVCSSSLLGIGDERYVWSGNQVRVATDPDATWDRRVGDDPWGDDGGTGLRLGYRGELALDGLLFLGARVYDTSTRCFLSRDPRPSVAGAVTYAGLYSYAWCDPVNLVDPSGERPLSDEEYAAVRESEAKGVFRRAAEAVADDPWGYLAKAAIVVGSIAVMTIATATLGPVGMVIAGGVVGAVSSGLWTAVDGGDAGDIFRSAAIGGLFGAATAGLGNRFLPPGAASTATTATTRAVQNGGQAALVEFPMAFIHEGVDSYLPGGDGDYSVTAALRTATIGTVAHAGGREVEYGRTPRPGPDPVPGPDLTPGDGAPTPPVGPADGPSTTASGPSRTTDFDINTATADDFQRAHGIGPKLAEAIVQRRTEVGGFSSPEAILDVHGVGPAKLKAIQSIGAE
jgi:competence ComEA-like helix-hairpin-helix protein